MATTKSKSTTSKATNAKKAPVTRKKSQVKKASSKNQTVKSFRVSKPEQPFMTFNLTRQTVYWLVLGAVVVVFALWITKLQADVQSIYDTIDMNTAAQDTYVPMKKQ
jgi:hypothetical protein